MKTEPDHSTEQQSEAAPAAPQEAQGPLPEPVQADKPVTQETQEQAEQRIAQAAMDELLLRKLEIEGIKLYDYSLATGALLEDTKSPFLTELLPSQYENLELAVAVFLVIHSTDIMDDDLLAELSRDVKDPDRIRNRALQFARLVRGNKHELATFCLRIIGEAGATAMRVLPKPARRGDSLEEFAELINASGNPRPKA